ncbi:LCP family protein [Okibacterium endophyticum]
MRHGRQRHYGAFAAVTRTLAIVVAVVVVSAMSVAGYAVYNTGEAIVNNAVDINQPGESTSPIPEIGDFEGGFNILLSGVDNDPNQDPDRWGDRDSTVLNDVNMLIHIAEDHQSGVVVSFPRDLMIPHPECTDPETDVVYPAMRKQMLNTAFTRGGLSCAVETVENLTGLDIPFAAYITFDGVIGMTNAVGGVPVCLAEPIRDSSSGLDLPAGINTISGDTALAFLRTRKAIGDGSDLARIAVQQQYMSSLVRTLKDNGTLTDITKLYPLARTAAKTVVLSQELANLNTMIAMAQTLGSMSLDALNLVQYPVGTDPDDTNRVVPITSLADELMTMIAGDQQFSTDPNARRPGVEASAETALPEDPSVPADPDPSVPVDPGQTSPPTDAAPPVIDGLVGQSAAEESCVVSN